MRSRIQGRGHRAKSRCARSSSCCRGGVREGHFAELQSFITFSLPRQTAELRTEFGRENRQARATGSTVSNSGWTDLRCGSTGSNNGSRASTASSTCITGRSSSSLPTSVAGLETTRCFGVAGEIELRMTRNGYRPVTQTIMVSDHNQRQNIELALVDERQNVAGTYTLTTTAAAHCQGALPTEALREPIGLTFVQDGPTLGVLLSGATILTSLNRFSGRVEPGQVVFDFHVVRRRGSIRRREDSMAPHHRRHRRRDRFGRSSCRNAPWRIPRFQQQRLDSRRALRLLLVGSARLRAVALI